MSRKTIMYIEDDVDACYLMTTFLNGRGFNTVVAFTGEKAYALLKRHNPDLMLIDIKLIGMSGIDFIEKIQKEGIQTPVIILTAYADKIAEIELKGLKVYSYLVKPYEFSELYQTIKEVFKVT